MDFIEGLKKFSGKNAILVVVCRFTKYGHFLPLVYPFSTSSAAKRFLYTIFRLHGMPQTTVSDRDKVFTSLFWKELFKGLGTTLHFSSTYHPQMDEHTERLNQCLTMYLRCITHSHPTLWNSRLPLAEWWYNSTYRSAIKMSPFEALYGYAPLFLSIIPLKTCTSSTVGVVGDFLTRRQQLAGQQKENLQMAQNRMKQNADKKRIKQEFEMGDWVYLKYNPIGRVLCL